MLLNELIENRELVYYFTWREFKVRYKQTIIGVLWVIFQPLFFAIIINLTLLRGRSIEFGRADLPSLIPVYIGLLFWNYFEQSINNASNSLVGNQSVITKVYFPRYIPSLATTIAAVIDFGFAAIVLLLLGPIMHYNLRWQWLPIIIPLLFLVFLFVNGAGLLLATLNIKYRDVRFALPFLMRIMLFATPVFYPLSFLPARLHWIVFINPVTAAIEITRKYLLGLPTTIPLHYIVTSIVSTLIFCVVGYWYFKHKERTFADII